MPAGEPSNAFGTPVLNLRSDSLSTRHKILFLGDMHWDHPRCDRRALKKVLDQAVAEDAWIVMLGDQLCLMQVTGDKRGSKASIRPEHQRDDYLTAVIEDAIEWFKPYKDHIFCVLNGNHESAVERHHNVNVTRHLAQGLGDHIQTPGYSSYALLRMFRQKQRTSVPIWLAHGHGGGGPVTKGTIQAQRRAVTFPDARVVVSGHIHNSYFIAHEQHRLAHSGRAYDIEQEHYVVSSWKDEFKGGKGGWHVESGRGPVVPSGWWSEWWMGDPNKSDPRWSFWRAKP